MLLRDRQIHYLVPTIVHESVHVFLASPQLAYRLAGMRERELQATTPLLPLWPVQDAARARRGMRVPVRSESAGAEVPNCRRFPWNRKR